MTSHAHLIIGTSGTMKLEDIIRDFKAFTSRHIRKSIENSLSESRKDWMLNAMKQAGAHKINNKDFQFWMQHNHPIEMNSNEIIDSRITSIKIRSLEVLLMKQKIGNTVAQKTMRAKRE